GLSGSDGDVHLCRHSRRDRQPHHRHRLRMARSEDPLAVSEATESTTAMFARRQRWAQNWRRFTMNRLASFGLFLVAGMTILALLAPVIAPWGPFDISGQRLVEPGASHWFGTDNLGREIFAGVLYGARTSLLVGLLSVLLALFIGIIVGAIAGYYGGRIDDL